MIQPKAVESKSSALNAKIHVTVFSDRRATKMKEHAISLRELGDGISNKPSESKEQMRHIKLSRFSGERTERGSYRHNAGQISVSGVEGDYDAGTMTPEEAAERLRREQVAAVVYTTPSHQKDGKGQRWRVLCPFSQEMNPAERQKMVARLNGVLGGVLSAESFTASQSFAFGSVSGQPVPAVEFVEGRYLDQCSGLDTSAVGRLVSERDQPVPAADMSGDASKVERAGSMLERAAERLAGTLVSRNEALCREAYLAGGLLANSLVSTEQIMAAFLPAMSENGYLEDHAGGREEEVERIIETQLKAGQREPFTPAEHEFDDEASDFETMSDEELLQMEFDAPDNTSAATNFLESVASLEGLEVPQREWMVPELIPHRTVTILGGDGGTGKSLLALQLAVSTAANIQWISREVSLPGSVIYISAEDERDELHRRFNSVCDATGIPFSNLSRLYFKSLAGEGAILAELDRRSGKMRPTKLFRALSESVESMKPSLVVLDTLADLHSGDQNDQSHARQFITLLRGLSVKHGCTVLLLAHPSLTGITTGTGTGGSMAWNNSVRSRLYLRRSKDGGRETDPDARILETMKSNYGRVGGQVSLRWKAGVFQEVSDEDEMEVRHKAEMVFIKLLKELNSQDRRVSHKPGPNFAPKLFADHPKAEGTTKRMFRVAMEELLSDKRVKVVEDGPPSKRRQHLTLGSFGFD